MTLREFIEETFAGCFWTRLDEMIDDIEQVESRMLAVVYSSDEYIEVADYEEDEEVVIYIGHAGSTMWIQNIKEV